MKVEIFKCDNDVCPDESETMELDKNDWVGLVRFGQSDKAAVHFCKERCLLTWAQHNLG